jgi:mycothiol synthase
MPISERSFTGVEDWPQIMALLDALPAHSRHGIDLPYRLCSPLLQAGTNARLWFAPDGTVVGFAAWAAYWAKLDFLVPPGTYQQEVERAIFAWALPHFRDLDAARGRPLPYWAEFREDDTARAALLAANGFTLDEDYHSVQFHHPLGAAIPNTPAPDGITIRPLAGTHEVAACVAVHRAAFQSTAMTEDWRERTRSAPHHQAELDLVAQAADGTLVGYCLGWFDAKHQQGQVEPLGILPAYQGHGIGRALLIELLRRCAALGAQQVLVKTDSTRPSALRVYESVGFAARFNVVLKGIWATPRSTEQVT